MTGDFVIAHTLLRSGEYPPEDEEDVDEVEVVDASDSLRVASSFGPVGMAGAVCGSNTL